ncbi:alpha/beta hydrolase [Leptolyngbya sp. FACHB-321]|uniref:alpha/beta hydrolase n=1 Tax=Leptolyngbya sp. FACHB-321 TaxID=2692807 RepID=UPI001685B340|nr:alpha/beta hydrolase-fold protein [Leptolyngbya sp. FACHB-321]MBD2035071.1 alpha/beta hydrolase [Leptolyngbya sp. FACHB-321]
MGNITIIRDFYSDVERMTRTLRIFIPEAYTQQPNQSSPVLYMLDGQNVFSHPESAAFDTWCANTTMEALVSAGTLRPWIIVGIDSTRDRMIEYSPWAGGRGDLCAQFLVSQLKPYIDRTYRTLPQPQWTSVMGSSMGGLLSLYIGKKYANTVGRISGLSPALMWGGDQMFKLWDQHTELWSKIYLYVGSQEQHSFYGAWLDYVPVTRDFYKHLKQLGYSDHEVHFLLAEGETHYETSWQRRLPEIWRWLLEEPKAEPSHV